MNQDIASSLKHLRAAAIPLIKYQIVTKALQSIILFPLFWFALQQLLRWRGIPSLTNANIGAFLLSFQGAVFVLLLVLMVGVTLLMEVGGFLTLSARSLKGKNDASYHQVFWANLRTVPALAGPGMVVIVLFVGVLLPLAGTSLNVSFLADIHIPNFITSVIYSSPLYVAAYWAVLGIAQVLAFFAIFTFHFMILGGLKTLRAITASFRMVWRNFWQFLGFMLAVNVLLLLAVLTVVAAVVVPLLAVRYFIPLAPFWTDFLGVLGTILLAGIAAIIVFIAAPYELFFVTNRYYTYLERRANTQLDRQAEQLFRTFPHLPEKSAPHFLDRLFKRRALLASLAALALVVAAGLMTFAASFVTQPPQIALVGHRGGPGNVAIENTMEAIDYSIANGAAYVEVDVQRTQDGGYIIHHDSTFERLAGDARSSTDMTLAQTRDLDLGATSQGKFSDIRVPSLEELLEKTQGKIGIFLELKGATADHRMVDDTVATVKAHGMLNDVVFMSLDYDIITYIEDTYPEVTSGYTYFLSVGETETLVGDYLILEEDAATRDLIDRVHAAGKKTAVWTVNTEESMKKFVNWPIDAVITDYPAQWQEVSKERQKARPVDVIINEFVE